MLYKGCIGVNKAARLPEGGPAETGALSASNLLLIDLPSGTNDRRPSQGREILNIYDIDRHIICKSIVCRLFDFLKSNS